MPTIQTLLTKLRQKFKDYEYNEEQKNRLPPPSEDDVLFGFDLEFDDRRTYQKRCDEIWEEMKILMADYDLLPERHHSRYRDSLREFQKKGAYLKSVFVMTKYPDPKDGDRAKELEAVIATVVRGIEERGFKPRVATDAELREMLWENVETYLCGCSRGVAILEDKYRNELNPNVAMEWGWMRGMGRRVLFLAEQDFQQARADWKGLIEHAFAWKDPEPGVAAALDKFLGPKK